MCCQDGGKLARAVAVSGARAAPTPRHIAALPSWAANAPLTHDGAVGGRDPGTKAHPPDLQRRSTATRSSCVKEEAEASKGAWAIAGWTTILVGTGENIPAAAAGVVVAAALSKLDP